MSPALRLLAKATTWSWKLGTDRQISSTVGLPSRIERTQGSGPRRPLAMTAPAPAATQPAAKLSTRPCAVSSGPLGRPGSELPEAQQGWLRTTTAWEQA